MFLTGLLSPITALERVTLVAVLLMFVVDVIIPRQGMRELYTRKCPRLLPGLTRRILHDILQSWLRALKPQAETDTGVAHGT